MSWMIGKNHCTVPTGRLTLGSKTNVNINYSKKTINNFGNGGLFPSYNMGMMGMGMGMGMYPAHGCYGSDRAATILTAVGAGIKSLGDLTAAIVGIKKGKTESSADTPQTQTPQNSEYTAAIQELKEEVQEVSAQLDTAKAANTRLQAQLADMQKTKDASAQLQREQDEVESLKKEGITKNKDGSYTTTYTDITGKEVEIQGADVDQLRLDKLEKQNEVIQQQKIVEENGITVNSDGTFSIETNSETSDGTTTTSQKIKLTSNTLDGLLEQMKEKGMEIKDSSEDAEQDDQSNPMA